MLVVIVSHGTPNDASAELIPCYEVSARTAHRTGPRRTMWERIQTDTAGSFETPLLFSKNTANQFHHQHNNNHDIIAP
jgi:hypothetical protein